MCSAVALLGGATQGLPSQRSVVYPPGVEAYLEDDSVELRPRPARASTEDVGGQDGSDTRGKERKKGLRSYVFLPVREDFS